MQASRDHAVTDTLCDFESILETAKAQLFREEARLETAKNESKNVQNQLEVIEKNKRDVLDRVEALENECSRIARLNDQRRATLCMHHAEIQNIKAPRIELESKATTISKKATDIRSRFCHLTSKASISLISSLNSRDPEFMKENLAQKQKEIESIKSRVQNYKNELLKTSNPIFSKNLLPFFQDDDNAIKTLITQYENLLNDSKSRQSNYNVSLANLSSKRNDMRGLLRSLGQEMSKIDQALQETQQRYYDILDQSTSHLCIQCGDHLSSDDLNT